MPPSVHKALIHGHLVVQHLQFYSVPVGMLSEEAQETSNKKIKAARLRHARTFSRVATMTDIYHWRIVCSDPYLSMLNLRGNRHMSDWDGSLPKEVVALLTCEVGFSNEDPSDSD
eukprot:Pompholyxophrys_punicea_v1_NODE_541_length_1718_cov_135.763680.p4 type:complete len:115 gc:universal NODE_541_length_1718_cov_135.763680:364-20(-)